MCGKFTQLQDWTERTAFSDVDETIRSGGIETITPMRLASVIALNAAGTRKAVRMRWGMVAPGTADAAKAKPHIHARAETIDSKPAFREAFAKRRGLLVVSTFNEGREVTPTKTEQYVLSPCDGGPIGIAVIWHYWRTPDSAGLLSFAMVTVPPCPLIATITDRMPALIAPSDWPLWLGEAAENPEAIKALLKTSDRPLVMQKAVKPGRATKGLF